MHRLATIFAAAVLTLGCALTPEKWPHATCTSEAWKAATWEQRYVYYESLAEQRLLDGATRERVIELLGPGGNKTKPASITYAIRRRPLNPWMAEVRVLDIRLTPEG